MQVLIVEPQATFDARQVRPAADFGEYTEADALILGAVRNEPQRLTTVLNQTARLMPARSKRQRMAIKREILLRLGSLIRHGQLRRIRRKFIGLPYRWYGSSFACAARRGSTATCALP